MKRATLLLALLLFAGGARAQELRRLEDLVPRGPEFGGTLELFTESYQVDGRRARRPSGTARLLLRPYVRFGEAFEVGADILLSTEQNSFDGAARQRINRFGLNPTWGWGSAHLGDFALGYTPLTYEGIPVRGAAIDLHPGLLRFSVLGGQTQRAVAGDATNGTYGRRLYAARLGIGEASASWFDVIALYADDDIGSLAAEPDYAEPDTNEVGTPVALTSVTPQQNLVVAASGRLSLWDRKLVWRGELAGSAYTRDKRASEVEDPPSEVPSWLLDIFPARYGSHVDLAGSTDLQLRLAHWDVQGGYLWVGPGYRSLGVGSLLVDRQVVRGRTAFHARRFGATVHGSRQRDNVLGQKLETTRRDVLATALTYQPGASLLLRLNASFNTMNRGATDPAQRIDYLNQIWGGGVRHSLRRRWLQSVGIEYRYQEAAEANPARRGADFRSHQIVAPVSLRVSESLQLTPQFGLVRLKHPFEGWQTTHTEKLALRHAAMRRRWITTLSVGTSFDDGARRLVTSVNSSYNLTSHSSLRFVLRDNVFRTRREGGDDWDELVVQLSLRNRW